MRAYLTTAMLIGFLMLAACDDGDAEVVAEDPTPTPVVEAEEEEAEPEATPTTAPDPTPTPEPSPEPSPTSEAEETPTPDTAPTNGDETGTRDNPVPLGEAARVGDWEIVVTDTIPDAWDVVPELQIINDPPEESRQFFMIRLRATYHGEESSQFWFDFELSAVGADGNSYDNYGDSCGINPDEPDLVGQASTDESVDGSICWSVRSDSAETLMMIVEDWLAMPTDRFFFALTEE